MERVKNIRVEENQKGKRVECFFLLLILLLFRPLTCLYTQCVLSVISAFSFHMPPAVAIVLHFCPFTPYMTTLPLRLYNAYTISALQHTYTISTLQLADTPHSQVHFSTERMTHVHYNSLAYKQMQTNYATATGLKLADIFKRQIHWVS